MVSSIHQFGQTGRARMGALAVTLLLVVASTVGCDEDAIKPRPDAGVVPGGLTPQQAAAVVAKVGDKTITLGEFAAAIERLPRYDRLRFQTKERRRQFLQELVDTELLAQEARRRGLDKNERVQDAVRQVLRDAMLAEARKEVPHPDKIPEAEVRAYYEKHRDRYQEPERRRVSAIIMTDKAAATHALAHPQKATTGGAWGELFHKHSVTAPKKRNPAADPGLSGDLGVVGPVGDPQGAVPAVPKAVQEVVFTLTDVGAVYDQLVEAGGKFYIVRLAGRAKARSRTLAEAERDIRFHLYSQQRKARQTEMLEKLRQRFMPGDPKQYINEDALKRVEFPKPSASSAPKPGGTASP